MRADHFGQDGSAEQVSRCRVVADCFLYLEKCFFVIGFSNGERVVGCSVVGCGFLVLCLKGLGR